MGQIQVLISRSAFSGDTVNINIKLMEIQSYSYPSKEYNGLLLELIDALKSDSEEINYSTISGGEQKSLNGIELSAQIMDACSENIKQVSANSFNVEVLNDFVAGLKTIKLFCKKINTHDLIELDT